jgi:hypothetical protein
MNNLFFKTHIIGLLFSIVILIWCAASTKQVTSVSEVEIPKAIETGSWTFTVSQVIPQFGRSRQANGNYTVDYNEKKLTVYLPNESW